MVIDSIRAELAEIDENVIRRNLTNTEVSGLLARRKKLYETLHPETITKRIQNVRIIFNFLDELDMPEIGESVITETTYRRRKTA